MSPTDEHYLRMANLMGDGLLMPFLGAGVHLSNADHLSFARRERPPSGGELAALLAEQAAYPEEDATDLLRVSQFLSVILGDGALYGELRKVFEIRYPPTPIHRFLARVPKIIRARPRDQADAVPTMPIIVTTNYDDALEQAFQEEGEPIDVLTYVAKGDDTGKLLHRDPTGSERLVNKPNTYSRVTLDERPVILKIHGTINRANEAGDSYVITEDHYIEYLTRTELKGLVPVRVAEEMKRRHFLFLGYSLGDWNLRVILHRIWESRNLQFNSWAVLRNASDVDVELWHKRGVKIVDADVGDYIARLEQVLTEPKIDVG